MKARLLAAALTASPVLALAHQAGLSYGSFALRGDRLEVVLRLPAAELSAAWGRAAAGDLRDGVPEDLARALLATIAVAQRSGACASTQGAGQLELPDGLRFSATFQCPRDDEPVEVRLGFVPRMLPGHVHLARTRVGSREAELVVDSRHEEFRVGEESASWSGRPGSSASGPSTSSVSRSARRWSAAQGYCGSYGASPGDPSARGPRYICHP